MSYIKKHFSIIQSVLLIDFLPLIILTFILWTAIDETQVINYQFYTLYVIENFSMAINLYGPL